MSRTESDATRRVLIVDDEKDIRDVVGFELTFEGYTIAEAGSGEEAVVAVKEQRFDVAIVDYKMPGLHGIAALTALLEIDPALPVIISTGCSPGEVESLCLDAGAFACLWKPFELEDMLALVKRAAARRNG